MDRQFRIQLTTIIFLVLTGAISSLNVCAQSSHLSDEVVYKQVDTVTLKLDVY